MLKYANEHNKQIVTTKHITFLHRYIYPFHIVQFKYYDQAVTHMYVCVYGEYHVTS